jgi:hypothetical protein
MTVPGLLIEYLITGAIGIVWIGWLLNSSSPAPHSWTELTAAHVTLLLPVAYVIGTFIDFVGRVLTRAIDEKQGRRGKHGSEKHFVEVEFCFDPPTIRKQAVRVVGKEEMFIRAPEAAKQYELRKTRDRVARGVFANFMMMTFAVSPIVAYRAPADLIFVIPVLVSLSWFSYLVWAKMVELSVTFRNDTSIAFLREEERAAAAAALVPLCSSTT